MRFHDLDSLTIGRLNVDLKDEEDVVPLLALLMLLLLLLLLATAAAAAVVLVALPLFDMVVVPDEDPDELDVSEAGESSSRWYLAFLTALYLA